MKDKLEHCELVASDEYVEYRPITADGSPRKIKPPRIGQTITLNLALKSWSRLNGKWKVVDIAPDGALRLMRSLPTRRRKAA